MNSNWSSSPESLNSGQNRGFFVPCDLEMWRMTLQNNRTTLLCRFKLCASFHSHQWIQPGVTVRNRPIWGKIDVFCPVWTWNLTDDLENNKAPLLCYFKLCATFLAISGNAQFGSKSSKLFAVWPWNLTDDNNKTPILSSVKHCASFHHHMWIQSGVTVRKRLNWLLTSVTLTSDLWPWPFAWTSRLSLVMNNFHDDTMMET